MAQTLDASDFLATSSATVWSVVSGNALGPPVLSNVGGLELDWGYWNKADIQVSTSVNGTTAATAPGDGLWAVFRPADMQNLTGQVSYVSDTSSSPYLLVADYEGTATPSILMEFIVELGSGTIPSGRLEVIAGNQEWTISNFTGTIQGAFATMQFQPGAGQLDLTNGAQDIPITRSSLGGAFIGTGDSQGPAFLGGFTLETDANVVQGLVVAYPDPGS